MLKTAAGSFAGDSRQTRTMTIEIRDTPEKGRGVFASKDFASGEPIETTPVILITPGDWFCIAPTVLADYVFNFGPEKDHAAIALGFGSLYNHSYSPNARYFKDWDRREIRFVAVRAIRSGEEITVNYNGAPDDSRPIWFGVRQ
jgi:SET domain-containing protein